MRIVSEPPPSRIYNACVKQFGVSFDDGVVFTYGDTVHSKYPMSKDLEIHEGVHVKQQVDYGVVAWWDKYLTDEDFRLSQELEAYKAQYKWAKKNIKSRDDRAKLLTRIARDLSGTMYGNLLTYQEALVKIKNG